MSKMRNVVLGSALAAGALFGRSCDDEGVERGNAEVDRPGVAEKLRMDNPGRGELPVDSNPALDISGLGAVDVDPVDAVRDLCRSYIRGGDVDQMLESLGELRPIVAPSVGVHFLHFVDICNSDDPDRFAARINEGVDDGNELLVAKLADAIYLRCARIGYQDQGAELEETSCEGSSEALRRCEKAQREAYSRVDSCIDEQKRHSECLREREDCDAEIDDLLNCSSPAEAERERIDHQCDSQKAQVDKCYDDRRKRADYYRKKMRFVCPAEVAEEWGVDHAELMERDTYFLVDNLLRLSKEGAGNYKQAIELIRNVAERADLDLFFQLISEGVADREIADFSDFVDWYRETFDPGDEADQFYRNHFLNSHSVLEVRLVDWQEF